LRLQLSREQQAQLAQRQPANNEAYQSYLMARFIAENAYTEAAYNQELFYLRKALEYDPNFALAYTGIASCYALMADLYLPMEEAIPKAREAVQRALELDPQSAEAHVAQALVYYIGDWDFSAAEASLVRALELKPNDTLNITSYAMLLLEQGRGKEAVAHAQRAWQLDAMSEHNGIILSRILGRQGRFEEAQVITNKLLNRNPQSVPVLSCLAANLIQQGRLPEALEVIQRGLVAQRHLSPLTALGYVQGRLGHLAEARKIAAEIEQLAKKQPVPPTWHARVYVGMNDPARALAVLQKGYAAHSQYMVALLAEPMLDGLRQDPQFITLVKQVGLPQ
jgi:serine/threonine-protein kinase